MRCRRRTGGVCGRDLSAAGYSFRPELRRGAARSDLPLLVNTSLNPRGEPMPATLAQAVPPARRLGFTYLAIDGRSWKRGGR